jgi:hypothetical protein
VTEKLIGILNNYGQKAADGDVAKRVKSGLLTISVAKFEIQLIIPLIQDQPRELPVK